MNCFKTTLLLLLIIGGIIIIDAAPIETLKLKFKISGRDLPSKDKPFGKSDPYAEIFYAEEGRKDEVKLGKTSTITDNENPDWGDVFEFDFVRSKRQRLIFRLYDEDDLREDDSLGQAYVDVSDFVDKGQHLNVNLNKKGYVIVDTVIPVVNPTSAPSVAPLAVVSSSAPPPVVQTPPEKTPMKLKFKLSAKDLPNKDKTGHSDPFVELLFTEGGSSKQKKFATSSVIKDNSNPVWNDVFEFQYDPTKAQKWFFEVRDSDDGDSDGLGEVWVDVMDYISKGQKITVNLVKTGTLTIEAVPSTSQPLTAAVTPTTVKPTSPPTTTSTKPPPVKLRFTLYARNLEDKDILGTSDPYVKVYVQKGSDPEILLGNTKKFDDKENVDFPDVFEFTYDPSVKSKFRFLVLDEDDNRVDDELGNVSTDVGDYVKSGENLTLNLNKGTLTVVKA